MARATSTLVESRRRPPPDPCHPAVARQCQTNVEAYRYDKHPESRLTRSDGGCRQQCRGRCGAICNSPPGTVAELYRPVWRVSTREPSALGLVGRISGAFAATPRAPRALLFLVGNKVLWFIV